jgi:CheY-like chemotaxis protein/curved DNA-binding protein CbpA
LSLEVLIAEDDVRLARLLARSLDRAGYAVRTTQTGEEALAEARRIPPALILLDLLLPGMDGRAVLAELSCSPTTSAIPVVAMSGVYPSQSDGARDARKNAVDFLEKPFETTVLLQVLRRVIGPPPRPERRHDLREAPAATLLWCAVEEEFTGALHFRREDCEKSVLFDAGNLRAVRSSLEREFLGERLCAQGRITREACDVSASAARSLEQLQGQALIDMGALTSRELPELLEDQAFSKLLDLCGWCAGEMWRQPGARALAMATPIRALDPETLIFRGAQQMSTQHLASVLAKHRSDMIVVDSGTFDAATLGGAVLRLFARLTPGMRVGDLGEEHLPTLHAAYVTGRVGFVASGAEARSGGASAGELEVDLAQRVARQARQDLFGVLGVTPAAPPDELRIAYQKLRKRWTPEQFASQPRRVRDLAGQLRGRLELAYDVLGDACKRLEYLRRLEEQLTGAGSAAEPNSASMTRLACSEVDLVRAERHAQQGEFSEALAILESLLVHEPDQDDVCALYGWALFGSRPDDERVAREAIQQLTKSMERDARSPAAPYYLGCIYRRQGKDRTARQLFRRALDRDSGYMAADRALRELSSRET